VLNFKRSSSEHYGNCPFRAGEQDLKIGISYILKNVLTCVVEIYD